MKKTPLQQFRNQLESVQYHNICEDLVSQRDFDRLSKSVANIISNCLFDRYKPLSLDQIKDHVSKVSNGEERTSNTPHSAKSIYNIIHNKDSMRRFLLKSEPLEDDKVNQYKECVIGLYPQVLQATKNILENIEQGKENRSAISQGNSVDSTPREVRLQWKDQQRSEEKRSSTGSLSSSSSQEELRRSPSPEPKPTASNRASGAELENSGRGGHE
jgi:hypothetical protein